MTELKQDSIWKFKSMNEENQSISINQTNKRAQDTTGMKIALAVLNVSSSSETKRPLILAAPDHHLTHFCAAQYSPVCRPMFDVLLSWIGIRE